MADTITLNPGTGGAVLATDDIGGTHYQIVKLAYGALDSQTLVDTTNRFPTAAAQSGTWNITNVSGTVSLPTGAATAAKQPALGTAGSASADVISVQGIASMTPLQVSDNGGSLTVDGTVGISGTVAVTDNAGSLTVDNGGTFAVQAAQSGTWTVQPGNTANTTAWLVTGTGGSFPVTDSGGSLTVDNGGTFAVQATQSGNWSVRNQDGAGNAITSAARGSERAMTVQIVDGTGTQVTSFGGSGTPSAISTNNSTTSVLAGGAAFTGTADEITQYSSVTVAVIASHASATDGLQLQQSSDGTNWDIVDSFTVPATTGKTFGVQVTARYFRVVYTNGATLQTSFRLQTILHTVMPNSSSVRPQDARTNDNDMMEVVSYLAGYNGTTWDRLRSDTTNGLDVDVTRVSGTVAVTQSGTWSLAANQSTNIAQINGVTPLMGNGVTGTGSHRVTIASDNTAFSVNATPKPATSGGLSVATGSITATATSVKAAAGQVYGWYFYNPNASVAYVQFFNTATGSVTLGTTAPVYSIGIPATSGANVLHSIGIAHSTAITIAVTTTRAGSTSPGSSLDYNVFYS